MNKLTLISFLIVIMVTSCASHQKAQATSIAKNKTEITKNPALVKTAEPTPILKEEMYLQMSVDQIHKEVNEEIDREIDTITEKANEKIEVVKTLDHTAWNKLLKNYVSPQGNVNYEGLRKERKSLRAYLSYLGENVLVDTSSKNEKLSYWMNAYNAMTVDLILQNLPLESIKDIKNPWDQKLWKLGDKWYDLNEIEHQILRKMGDPRIHFGINCASFSCPPLLNEAFTAVKVNEQLAQLSISFINDPKRNTISSDFVEISKIFDWFSKDFKQNGSLIDFLNTYSKVEIDANAKVRFQEYNWQLNK